MIYNCYLDDSKDQKQEQMIISAGFFAPMKAWQLFRLAWNTCLRKHGIHYFKTSEFRMLTGQFQKFKSAAYPIPTGRAAADKIRNELRMILDDAHGINGIGIAIPVADYEEVSQMPEAANIMPANPYHGALVSIFAETLKCVGRKFRGRNMAAFVHDDGNDFPELHSVYKGFMNENPHWAKHSGGFQPLDDTRHPELQAADMAANYALQLGQTWLTNGRSEPEREQFKKSIKWIGVWEKTYILKLLVEQYAHRKLPIPQTLLTLAT
jgi:hypothetical protein